MRYSELFEFDDITPAPAAPPVETPAAKPAAEKLSTKVYFHVTTKHRLKSIEQNGIEPNHKRRWKTGFGRQLGERGNIYLISDFTAAVRWAYKQQWEHFGGKDPDPSPYIIICVRENPKALTVDPHPDNGVYGNTFFQKKGTIAPEDIMKVIPLTKNLIKQVIKLGESLIGGTSIRGITSNYSLRKCLKLLGDRGWYESTVPDMFINSSYPEYHIDLDIHSIGDGPFTVYKNNHRIAVTRDPPIAQQLGLKDRLTDKPLPPAEESDWDFLGA